MTEQGEPVMMTDDLRHDVPDAGNTEGDASPDQSPAFAVPEQQVAQEPPYEPGLMERMRRLIAPDRARLRDLDREIARNPAEAVNYLLRGDLLLMRARQGDEEAAAVDFYKALRLSEAQFDAEDWGITSQLVRDQALSALNDLLARGIVIEFDEVAALRSDIETVQSENSPE